MKKHKGFTFIEILVVITIIGILTAVGVTNFRVANQKAKDGRRQADLEQIRAALELYRSDQNQYPLTGEFPLAGDSLAKDGITYISDRPEDPVSGRSYKYTSSAGATYALCAALELGTDTVTGCGGASGCGTSIRCNYKVTNPL